MDKAAKKEAAKRLLESFKEKKKLSGQPNVQVPEKKQPSDEARAPLIDTQHHTEPAVSNFFDTVQPNQQELPQFSNNVVDPSKVYHQPVEAPIFPPSVEQTPSIPIANGESVAPKTEIIPNSEEDDSGDLFSQVELANVCKQLEFHKKTVEFLVMEKNELAIKVGELENYIGRLKTDADDLNGRLGMSRHKISNLELENYNCRQKNQLLESQVEKLNAELSKHRTQDVTIKTKYEDVEEELREARTLLNAKITENKDLAKKLDDLTFRINSGEFHFQQPEPKSEDQRENFQEQIQYLTKQLQEVEIEKTQSNVQYQQYVEQLNIQIQTMKLRQDELENENERLSSQEASFMEQMNALEKQLQMQSQRNPLPSAPVEPVISKEDLEKLHSHCNELTTSLQNRTVELQKATYDLNNQQRQIEELTETLQMIKSETPDVTKLNAANESDRLAAQKATSQNAQLKLDIEHLQEAYDEMTHDKLELTELLQAEKELSRALTLKLAENEETYKDIHTKLFAKDEEMIRLQAASSELQKELLKQAQIQDRLQHYEAQHNSSDSLQSELQILQRKVATLEVENERLKASSHHNGFSSHKEHDHDHHHEHDDHDHHHHEHDDHDHHHHDDHDHHNHGHDDHEHHHHEKQEIVKPNVIKEGSPELCKTEAMEKLESKFINLMKEVADLSDEKQKLEHLVIQLQAETETICEYIALYQKQRSIFKQKEQEKNLQLSLLAKEREVMKEQLDHLNTLVRQLVQNGDSGDVHATSAVNTEAIQTADRIMDLLSDIKTSHLIEPNPECKGFNGVNHCMWCSGKLITV